MHVYLYAFVCDKRGDVMITNTMTNQLWHFLIATNIVTITELIQLLLLLMIILTTADSDHIVIVIIIVALFFVYYSNSTNHLLLHHHLLCVRLYVHVY